MQIIYSKPDDGFDVSVAIENDLRRRWYVGHTMYTQHELVNDKTVGVRLDEWQKNRSEAFGGCFKLPVWIAKFAWTRG
ncbi:hypothetical protein SAMN05446935_9986 [Burkholderia sp. YR290]|nr:hypothetical protein SAMN05446935_9986 [Burkholderia sp. YR290]